MKKILYVLALLAGTICLVVACSNDEPDTGNGNQDMEDLFVNELRDASLV